MPKSKSKSKHRSSSSLRVPAPVSQLHRSMTSFGVVAQEMAVRAALDGAESERHSTMRKEGLQQTLIRTIVEFMAACDEKPTVEQIKNACRGIMDNADAFGEE